MARTSKTMLKHFTGAGVLGEIVSAIVLKWLLLALPATLIGPRIVMKPATASIEELGLPGFVSGGAVCAMVYGKHWDSDTDVWVHCTEECDPGRHAIVGTGTNPAHFDVVYHTRVDPERCIEHFDLSIVQQGYFQGNVLATTVTYCGIAVA